jgi:hypothetical protein
MAAAPPSLARLLKEPALLASLSLADWDSLVPQGWASGLLARLAYLADEHAGSLVEIAEAPRQHLIAAEILAEKHQTDVRYDLGLLADALTGCIDRIILLKGAAYLAAGLPPARGRVFSDIDVLVPKHRLADVEAVLNLAGWREGEMDEYDRQYYRRWMHQIPPVVHGRRQSVLDVHHTIVPETARSALAAPELLFERAVPAGDRLWVLAPTDMVLHSATHLFNEGEFARGLRDLDDLDQLLRHFAQDDAFWPLLIERARELGLGRPLYYAVTWARGVFGTPVPEETLRAAEAMAPGPIGRAFMNALFGRALRPHHPTCRDALMGTALWLLYVRSHALRMPAHLLVPHLVRKALRKDEAQPETQNP